MKIDNSTVAIICDQRSTRLVNCLVWIKNLGPVVMLAMTAFLVGSIPMNWFGIAVLSLMLVWTCATGTLCFMRVALHKRIRPVRFSILFSHLFLGSPFILALSSFILSEDSESQWWLKALALLLVTLAQFVKLDTDVIHASEEGESIVAQLAAFLVYIAFALVLVGLFSWYVIEHDAVLPALIALLIVSAIMLAPVFVLLSQRLRHLHHNVREIGIVVHEDSDRSTSERCSESDAGCESATTSGRSAGALATIVVIGALVLARLLSKDEVDKHRRY